jgi:hypothetical protein
VKKPVPLDFTKGIETIIEDKNSPTRTMSDSSPYKEVLFSKTALPLSKEKITDFKVTSNKFNPKDEKSSLH